MLGSLSNWKPKPTASSSSKRHSKLRERAAHRPAAPFRIEEKKRVPAPKRPGRKQGHPGTFRHQPDQVDEYTQVELCVCPHCGGRQFTDQSQIQQTIEDIPPLRPRVIR